MTAPKENLVRAVLPGVEMRASEDGGMPTLTGHFAVFDTFTTIDSVFEGKFRERIAPGAFKKAFAEGVPKVLFQHGKDPQIGDKPLGVPTVLREDSTGAYYEVPLLDTSYNRDLIPGLQAGAYGASFRFSVIKDEWDNTPARSAANPDALPERTLREVRLHELGPVTFPAYIGATAGVRSMTDEFVYSRDQLEALLKARAAMPCCTDCEADCPCCDADCTGLACCTTQNMPEPVMEANALPPVGAERAHSEIVEPRTVTTSTPPIIQETRSVTNEYTTPEDRASRISELKSSLARQAVEFPGVMPEAAQAEWDGNSDELRKLEADTKAWETRQAFVRSLAGDEARTERIGEAPTVIRTKSTEDIYDLGKIKERARSIEDVYTFTRENALRSIDSMKLPKGHSADGLVDIIENRDAGEDGQGEIARRVLLTGSPTYRKAFNKYLKGQTALWSPEEARAAALAVTGTTTTGGYAVPYVFDPTLIHIGVYTAQNPFRAACRTETITNGNNWRGVTTSEVAMAYGTEALTTAEGGPTFGQPTYTVQTGRGFVTLSIEAMEDRPDITGELGSLFAEGKATLEENQFAVGTGATVYPLGMFTDTAYTNVDTATDNVTAIADLQLLEAALPLRFRANGAFFMNRSTLRQLIALDTGWRYFSGAGIYYAGQQNPISGPGLGDTGNTGLKCLGYPVWEVPSAVSTLTTNSAIIVVFCDPKSYIIVDRIGMNVEVIPQMLSGATPNFPTLQRGVVAWFRNTAKPHTADAGRSLSVQ